MRTILVLLAIAGGTVAVAADETTRGQSPPNPNPYAAGPYSNPYSPGPTPQAPQAYPDTSATSCSEGGCCEAASKKCGKQKPTFEQQMKHFEQAISHLQAAGLQKEAEYVGLLSLKQLARQKKSELELLERQIDAAEKAGIGKVPEQVSKADVPIPTKEPRQIIGHFKVIEIDRVKFAKQFRPLESDAALASTHLLEQQPGLRTNDRSITIGIASKPLDEIIQKLLDKGVAKILAEPTLITVDRRPARLHIGGEIPYPQSMTDGETAIQFKNFGTEVNWIPVLKEDNRVAMEVRLRVTGVDQAHTMKFNGFEMPSMNTREVDTGIEVKAGQTAILGGFVQKRTGPAAKTAAAGSRPQESKVAADEPCETELLVLIRPELGETLHAEAPGQRPAKR